MTFPTCKTCKHWDRNFGEAGYIGQCKKEGETPYGLSGGFEIDADCEGAALMTNINFGCIKHEAKE